MKIISIKPVPPRKVYAIKTSTGTYISSGLAHHNCASCNFNQGEQYKYAKALDFKYGDGTAEKLEAEAARSHHFTAQELLDIKQYAQEQIDYYESL